MLPSGDEIKVKYGEFNGEVHGEVAATRILWALGFGADAMYPVRILCRGCPDTIGVGWQPGERLVDPAIVERKMPGRELTRGDHPGWSWLELDLIEEEAGGATRAQRDALKLLAVLIQHTDSKPEQQRLVCLGEDERSASTSCEHPFMMINDLGLTFGRANLANSNLVGSVNFQEWAQTPVWKEDGACVGNLPKSLTGTLKDPIISEHGRDFLAGRLLQLSDSQIRALFEVARVDRRAVPQDSRTSSPVDEWVRVFKAKRKEIVDRRCDALWPGGISALFGTAPIHWLQDRSSVAMTAVMNGISALGYARVLIAIGVALAFLHTLRAGAALLLLLALTGVLTDGAKTIVSSPRPQAVDAAVKNLDVVSVLGDSFRSDSATPSVDSVDGYGFPSGHVAMWTAFFFGLGYFFRWAWVWPVMVVSIPAMAMSRVYLGRHFLGDVLGGVGVGVIAATIGLLALTLARLSNQKRATNAAVRATRCSGRMRVRGRVGRYRRLRCGPIPGCRRSCHAARPAAVRERCDSGAADHRQRSPRCSYRPARPCRPRICRDLARHVCNARWRRSATHGRRRAARGKHSCLHSATCAAGSVASSGDRSRQGLGDTRAMAEDQLASPGHAPVKCGCRTGGA